MAVMGNSMTRTVEHNIRLWTSHKTFIAHNRLQGNSSENIRHSLKLNASGTALPTGPIPSGTGSWTGYQTSQLVIADNVIGSSSNSQNWLLSVSPENDAQGIADVILERNRFSYGSNYFLDMHVTGRNIIGRGNWNTTANRAASTGSWAQNVIAAGWYGPFYLNDAPVEFSGASTVPPRAPASLTVE